MTQDNEWTDWLEHDGVVCPVPQDELVTVRLTTVEAEVYAPAGLLCWQVITHYKRKKSAVEAENVGSETPILQSSEDDGLLNMRKYPPVMGLEKQSEIKPLFARVPACYVALSGVMLPIYRNKVGGILTWTGGVESETALAEVTSLPRPTFNCA